MNERTTIKAAIDALANDLEANLVAEPPVAAKPFRRVVVGNGGPQQYPRPFLAVGLLETEPIGVADNDKLVAITMSLRIVTDVVAADPHAAMLDTIGAVDDFFDSVVDAGVMAGAYGFDDRSWKFEYPKATAGSRVAVAEAMQSFVVHVQREQNREPVV